MFDWLVQIPGPTFLLLFAGLTVICMGIGWLLIRADGSTEYPMPEPTRFNPLTIAYLIGGAEAVIRTAIFRLWKQEQIEFDGSSQDAKIKIPTSAPLDPSNQIEADILQLAQSQKPSGLLRDRVLLSQIAPRIQAIEKELEQAHLMKDSREILTSWAIAGFMAMILICSGGTKLALGISRGRPVLFLVISMIIAMVALFKVLKPGSKMTRLGRKYIHTLKNHFDWLKTDLKQESISDGIDPAWGVALFGTTVLAGSVLYEPFHQAFPMNISSESSSGSSSSGGCGDGGCGGGGCGGGCGGCGGCG